MNKIRNQVNLLDTWDLSPVYPSLQAWKQDLDEENKNSYASLFSTFKEKPSFSASDIQKLYDLFFSLERRLRKLHTYAHLLQDEQIDNEESKVAMQQIASRYHTFIEETSFIEPKILLHSEEELSSFCKDPLLQSYLVLMQRLVRMKKHTLSPEQEALVAMASKSMETPHKAFSSLTDADFYFADVEDSKGKKYPLTNATYAIYLRSPDQALRKNAYNAMFDTYSSFQNTLCDLLQGTVEGHLFYARAHKFTSCLEAALYPNNIPVSVYTNLIQTVRSHVDVLHRYVRLKKQFLQLDTMYPYDLYVPLTEKSDRTYTYEEATQLTLSAVSPLGKNYTDTLEKGLIKERWVDKYENKGKRSGAYSSGCYDTYPYILLNYTSLLRDVFTLAHEAGHSMHSMYSKSQPYHLADYPIFVAEVASTCNEELLSEKLLHNFRSSPREKASILNEKLEDLRATLFRQTLFAEFELFIHTLAEQHIPITPAVLNEKFKELNRFYYGEELEIPENFGIEWARIPHFYYNFYVYQYATGVSAATALAQKILHGTPQDVEAYIAFLRSGGSQFPIDTLKAAGVDMSSAKPIEETIEYFSSLLDQFEKTMAQEKLAE